MSLWGMNDGATITGKHTWTNDDATLADGSSGTNGSSGTSFDGQHDGDVSITGSLLFI